MKGEFIEFGSDLYICVCVCACLLHTMSVCLDANYRILKENSSEDCYLLWCCLFFLYYTQQKVPYFTIFPPPMCCNCSWFIAQECRVVK